MSSREVRRGVLFVQRRDGRDHFAECEVRLDEAGEVGIWSLKAACQRSFNRGLDLSHFEAVAVQQKRNGVYVIRLEGALEQPAVHFATESGEEAEAWCTALRRAMQSRAGASAAWAALHETGLSTAMLATLKALDTKARCWLGAQSGRPLLHAACATLGTAEASHIPKVELDILEALLQLDPEAARARCAKGKLAIHHALASAGRAHERMGRAVELLLQANEDSVCEPYAGSLPVHMACSALSTEAVKVMVRANCPLKRIQDFLGEPGLLQSEDARRRTPLQCAIAALETAPKSVQGAGRKLCAMLTQAEPMALTIRDAAGLAPVHHVARQADAELLAEMLKVPGTLQTVNLRDAAGLTAAEQLRAEQLRLQRSGARSALFRVERCLNLLRLGPKCAIFADDDDDDDEDVSALADRAEEQLTVSESKRSESPSPPPRFRAELQISVAVV